jgi:Domain of unknown function (DUF397)
MTYTGTGEMTMLGTEWRKSSFSIDGASCVEARRSGDDVEVRHSKTPMYPPLVFTGYEWKVFVAGVRDGEFDVAL